MFAGFLLVSRVQEILSATEPWLVGFANFALTHTMPFSKVHQQQANQLLSSSIIYATLKKKVMV